MWGKYKLYTQTHPVKLSKGLKQVIKEGDRKTDQEIEK